MFDERRRKNEKRLKLAYGQSVRRALRTVVYGGPRELPRGLPTVTESYTGLSARSSWPADISRVDLLACPTVLGGVQNAHLCHPAASPALHPVRNRLVVHVGGHSAAGHYYANGGADGQALLTYELVRQGFHVLGCCMPLTGFNVGETYTSGAIVNHDFSSVEAAGYSGLRPFIDGLIVALNHVSVECDFETIDLVGLSGGGWIVTLAACVDPRSRKSICIFGGAPFELRQAIGPSAAGDWEQSPARSWVGALNGLEEAAYVGGCCDPGRKRIMVMGSAEGVFPVGTHSAAVAKLRAWVDARCPAGQHSLIVDPIALHDISAETRALCVSEFSS